MIFPIFHWSTVAFLEKICQIQIKTFIVDVTRQCYWFWHLQRIHKQCFKCLYPVCIVGLGNHPQNLYKHIQRFSRTVENLPNDLLFQIDFASEYVWNNKQPLCMSCASIVFCETSREICVWFDAVRNIRIYNGNCSRFMQHNVKHFQFCCG